jgi:hypothetical protein
MYTKSIYAQDMFPIIIMYTYRRVRAISGGAALEPLGDAGEVVALVEGVLQLQFRRPPRPVPGERARAVRAAAVHALHVEYLGAERVPHRHEHHPVVRQLRHRRQPGRQGETLPTASAIRSVGAARGRKHVVKKRRGDGCSRRGLLAAALGAGAEEEAGGLACQALLAPQPAGRVEEGLHLRRHHAEPRGEPEEDAVGLRQLLRRDDRRVGLGWRAHLAEHLLGQNLRDLGV